jgi:hypothetical protein
MHHIDGINRDQLTMFPEAHKPFILTHNTWHSKIIGRPEKNISSAISPLNEMSPPLPTPSRCPIGITRFFLD